MKVYLYSDGSSRGNPGPGGYGTILVAVRDNGTEARKELSQGYELTTNNRMELMGVIAGLEALRYPCDVTVTSDSQYVVKAFNDHWIDGWIKRGWRNSQKEPVKNRDLWLQLVELVKKHKVTWVWVKGHNAHPQNERCDELATAAADGKDLLVDVGYLEESRYSLKTTDPF